MLKKQLQLCSRCRAPKGDRPDRYCKACRASYHREWRKRRIAKRLHALVLRFGRETSDAA
jgi:hypothetical protein